MQAEIIGSLDNNKLLRKFKHYIITAYLVIGVTMLAGYIGLYRIESTSPHVTTNILFVLMLLLSVIIINCLIQKELKPKPLEYLIAKYHPVNQTLWLYSHSAMREPTSDVMEHVYHDEIFMTEGYSLGTYPRKKAAHE